MGLLNANMHPEFNITPDT